VEFGRGSWVGKGAARECVDGGYGGVWEEEGENGGALEELDVWLRGEGGRTTWPVLPARTADVIAMEGMLGSVVFSLKDQCRWGVVTVLVLRR
jgi:hypothetical protein